MSQSAIRRANPDIIFSHWCNLILGLKISSLQFYNRLHQVLCARKVPEIEGAKIEFHEGGPFSAKRLYLRLKRERAIFEICAAPFGTGSFVSWRLGERGLRLNFLGLFLLIVGCFALGASLYDRYRFEFMFHPQPFIWGAAIAGGIFLFFFWLMRNAVGMGLSNLDALLLHTPVVAGFYERFLRPMTYYRIDLALMYEAAVHHAVLEVIDELTDAQNLPRLPESDRKPILRDFYKR